MKPKFGERYLCIKDVVMSDGSIDYVKGRLYVSEMDECITDEEKCDSHRWDDTQEHFVLLNDFDFMADYLGANTENSRVDALINHLDNLKWNEYQILRVLTMAKKKIKEIKF